MKATATIAVALLASTLVMGGVGQVSAQSAGGPMALEAGNTKTRMVGGVTRYQLSLDSPAQVTIRGEIWNPGGVHHSRLQGVLRDANRNVVAQAAHIDGGLLINEFLSPGNYILEVTSRQNGKLHSRSRYYLQTRIQ